MHPVVGQQAICFQGHEAAIEADLIIVVLPVGHECAAQIHKGCCGVCGHGVNDVAKLIDGRVERIGPRRRFVVRSRGGENQFHAFGGGAGGKVAQRLLIGRGGGTSPPDVVDADEHHRDGGLVGTQQAGAGSLRSAARVATVWRAVAHLRHAAAIDAAIDQGDGLALGAGTAAKRAVEQADIIVLPGDRIAEKHDACAGSQRCPGCG